MNRHPKQTRRLAVGRTRSSRPRNCWSGLRPVVTIVCMVVTTVATTGSVYYTYVQAEVARCGLELTRNERPPLPRGPADEPIRTPVLARFPVEPAPLPVLRQPTEAEQTVTAARAEVQRWKAEAEWQRADAARSEREAQQARAALEEKTQAMAEAGRFVPLSPSLGRPVERQEQVALRACLGAVADRPAALRDEVYAPRWSALDELGEQLRDGRVSTHRFKEGVGELIRRLIDDLDRLAPSYSPGDFIRAKRFLREWAREVEALPV